MPDKEKSPEECFFDRKTNRQFNYFWFGFIIYTAAYTISVTASVNYILCNYIEVIGLLFLVFGSKNLIRVRFENQYLRILYSFYFIWICVIIARGFSFNFVFLKGILFNAQQSIFLYFVPLILLFPQRLAQLKIIFKVIIILSIFYILYDVLFLNILIDSDSENNISKYVVESFYKELSIPIGFILLTYIYHSNRRILYTFFILFLSILFAVIRARRALLFMPICVLFFYYILVLYKTKLTFYFAILSVLVIAILWIFGPKIYNEYKNSLFSLITERVDEDTRTGVEVSFYQDMKTEDWIFGKGIQGSYYAPQIDEDEKAIKGYRDMIETDYLNIILKGGLINLLLLLFIAVPAIFKGLFYSKNILSKASAIWILLWIIYLYPTTITTFTLHYLLVWFSIGICYSKDIRSLPDISIMKYM